MAEIDDVHWAPPLAASSAFALTEVSPVKLPEMCSHIDLNLPHGNSRDYKTGKALYHNALPVFICLPQRNCFPEANRQTRPERDRGAFSAMMPGKRNGLMSSLVLYFIKDRSRCALGK